MGYIKDSVDGPGYTAPLLTPSSGWTVERQREEEARQERIAKRRATYPDRPVFTGVTGAEGERLYSDGPVLPSKFSAPVDEAHLDTNWVGLKLTDAQREAIANEAYWDEVAAAQLAADTDIEFRGTGGPRIHPGTEIPVTAPRPRYDDYAQPPLHQTHNAVTDLKWAGSIVPDPRTIQAGETRSVDPRTGAEKGTKLARFDLIPQGPLQQLAEHYGLGALKYDDHQWRAGYDFSKSYAALQRHLSAFWSGEEFDPDPAMEGATHLAAAAWHVFTLMEFMSTFPEGDDRWKKPQSMGAFYKSVMDQ